MSRFLTVALAVLACVFAYLVATGIALPAAASTRAMFIVSSVALLASAAAIVLVLTMATRLRAHRIEVQNLARSVDAAFADFTAQRRRGESALAPHVEAMETATATAESKPASHPDEADRRPIEIARAAPAQARIEPLRAVPMKQASATVAKEPSSALRLRPLLAAATGLVVGFDVLVAEAGDNGVSTERRRQPLTAASGAALERGLVLGAIEASSQSGFAGDRAPFHVAVSQALLGDSQEFAIVLEALRRLNGTARSVVLCLPTRLMEQPAQHSAALAKLAVTRSRLAAEGWPSSTAGVEALWRSGVSFLRLPATRLLTRDDRAFGAASLIQMLAASGMTAIATDVRSRADAAELGRLGVDLMTDTIAAEPVGPRPGSDASTILHL